MMAAASTAVVIKVGPVQTVVAIGRLWMCWCAGVAIGPAADSWRHDVSALANDSLIIPAASQRLLTDALSVNSSWTTAAVDRPALSETTSTATADVQFINDNYAVDSSWCSQVLTKARQTRAPRTHRVHVTVPTDNTRPPNAAYTSKSFTESSAQPHAVYSGIPAMESSAGYHSKYRESDRRAVSSHERPPHLMGDNDSTIRTAAATRESTLQRPLSQMSSDNRRPPPSMPNTRWPSTALYSRRPLTESSRKAVVTFQNVDTKPTAAGVMSCDIVNRTGLEASESHASQHAAASALTSPDQCQYLYTCLLSMYTNNTVQSSKKNKCRYDDSFFLFLLLLSFSTVSFFFPLFKLFFSFFLCL